MIISRNIESMMYIEIHVDGEESPRCVPIVGASKVALALEKKGKSFRLGNTV
jgi:hypothetical protein